DGLLEHEARHAHEAAYLADRHALTALAAHGHADARLRVNDRAHYGAATRDFGDDADQPGRHRHGHVAAHAFVRAEANAQAAELCASAATYDGGGPAHPWRLRLRPPYDVPVPPNLELELACGLALGG